MVPLRGTCRACIAACVYASTAWSARPMMTGPLALLSSKPTRCGWLPHTTRAALTGLRSSGKAGSFIAIDHPDKALHIAQQGGELPPFGYGLGSVAPMPQGVAIALRCTGRRSAVHPAASVRHRGRPAGRPGPRPSSATRAQVYMQFAVHGVVPPISNESSPRGFDHADDSLATRMHGTCSTVTFCWPLPRWRLKLRSTFLKDSAGNLTHTRSGMPISFPISEAISSVPLRSLMT
jgi:hypothetical protein